MLAIGLPGNDNREGQVLADFDGQRDRDSSPVAASVPRGPTDDDLELLEALELESEDPDWLELSCRSDEPETDAPLEDPLGMYLRDVGQSRLLTAEEEISLAMEMERGLIAERRIQECPGMRAEMKRLLDIQVQRGAAARRRMIESNLRLVIAIARKYGHRGVPLLDLVQDGNIGLMKAVEKFDHRRGFRFSTYATWWIRQAITRAIADRSRLIRIPVHIQEAYSKLNKISRQMVTETGSDLSIAELSAGTGLPEQRVQEVLDAYKVAISLENPMSDDGLTVGDLLEDRLAPDPIERAQASATRSALESVLAALPWREQRVLWLRFGFEDGRPRTLEEIGREINLTRERVRQLECQALQRLRHPSVTPTLQDLIG